MKTLRIPTKHAQKLINFMNEITLQKPEHISGYYHVENFFKILGYTVEGMPPLEDYESLDDVGMAPDMEELNRNQVESLFKKMNGS